MNICMLLHNDFTNDLRVHKEARDLVRAGHRVTIVAARLDESVELREAAGGYEVRRIDLFPSWRVRARESAVRSIRSRPASLHARLLEAIRQSRPRQALLWNRLHRRFRRAALELVPRLEPEAIHAHDLDTLDVGYEASRRLGVPLVYDSHELWRENNFLLKESPWRRWRFRRLEQQLIGRAARVITTTESRGEALERWYGIERPVIVMNCQDPVDLPPGDRLSRELELPSSARILLYQGLAAFDRGLLVGLDLLERLPETFRYVTLGNGRDLERLQRIILDRGLGSRAFTLGGVPPAELPSYTCSAHYGLSLIQNTSLSYYLSAPNKIFEYMTAGIPLVAGDFPELRRLREQGDVGELVDPADPEAAARAVLRLEKDPPRRERIRRETRRLVGETYNWPKQAEKLISLYDSLSAFRG
jgi:glycosyltransferase involved in cell wall biosynthesis